MCDFCIGALLMPLNSTSAFNRDLVLPTHPSLFKIRGKKMHEDGNLISASILPLDFSCFQHGICNKYDNILKYINYAYKKSYRL